MMEEWKGGKRCYKLRVAVQTLAKRIEHGAQKRLWGQACDIAILREDRVDY